ncbi:glycoside hydrolase family 76 protein [uncultured Mucilaginibacter sp.]|uniref:glycoside hydrolase family 76 protein n=1 Tax=uncultured Mucilaginibacter sp. TaxID=797541 RepID=UPI0025E58A03|nr:glycoside hydrolase family 76 protein [uncultured Mucilaginibacter sp.]
MKFNSIKAFSISGAILLVTGASSCLKDKAVPLYNDEQVAAVNYSWAATADSVQDRLYSSYLSANGKYFKENNADKTTFHYWPNAHALDVMVDAYIRTKNDVYKQRMLSLLNGIKESNGNRFQNNFYDDMEWLALSALRSYEVTNDNAYLDAVNILWTDIKTGRNDIQGGGIGWTKDRSYFKNTPANAPAIIFATRLYRVQKNAADLQIARELYTWLKGKLVDPANGILWDGVNYNNDGVITKNKYTYNQGVFIGAGLELYKTTNEVAYLNDAIRTAKATIQDLELSPGGILKDEGQGDGGLFKGILIRYLTLLVQEPAVPKADKDAMISFLNFNATTLYTQGISRPQLLINSNWKSKPGATIDLTTQLSGMMLLEAAATLSKQGLIK